MSAIEIEQASDPLNGLADEMAGLNTNNAGIMIGKAGKNVADLREETGVRASINKVVPVVHDRVSTVTGSLSSITKAYGIVAKSLLEGAPSMGMGGVVSGAGTHNIRLLVPHNQMGTVIGRHGVKIKQIQNNSGVRMVAQKKMLPHSTERIVEITGSPDAVQKAVYEIGKCLIDDEHRGYGTVLYNTIMRARTVGAGAPALNGANGTSTQSA